jgi:peptidoglycan/LPS O-acetylase OafA/YrhL
MTDHRASRLPPALSIYLDLVRFGAAVVVVLTHVWPVLAPAHPLPWPGHEAVVVFFVLSGFVIAHASNRPGLTLGEYANHRAARIWSVSIPALALSGLVAALVGGIGPTEAATSVSGVGDGVLRLVANALSVAQVWAVDLAPPLNAPFWSLNYEVWYYALFAAWAFVEGRTRTVALVALALVAGPKILLLLPVWVLGVVLYWRRPVMGERTALALLVVSGAAALLVIDLQVGVVIRGWMFARWPGVMGALQGSNQFVGDWLLALPVAVNFAAAGSLGRFGAPLLRCAGPIRAAAGCTLSAYLYHVPMMVLVVFVLGLQSWPALLAIAAGIALLAQVTERQLMPVRRWLSFAAGRRVRAVTH